MLASYVVELQNITGKDPSGSCIFRFSLRILKGWKGVLCRLLLVSGCIIAESSNIIYGDTAVADTASLVTD
jgi:hypothetical protein